MKGWEERGGRRAGSLNMWLEKHPGLGYGEGPRGAPQVEGCAQVFSGTDEDKKQTKQIRPKAWGSLLTGDLWGGSPENTTDAKNLLSFPALICRFPSR